MKKFFTALAALLFSLSILFSQAVTTMASETPKAFSIAVVQGGKVLTPQDRTVYLKKKPFRLVYMLNGAALEYGVKTYASLDPIVYNMIANKAPLEEITQLGEAGGEAEYDHNPGRDLNIHEGKNTNPGYNSISYTSEDENRFDRAFIKMVDGIDQVVGWRTISRLAFFKEAPDGSFTLSKKPLSKLKNNDLYISFILADYSGVEIQREALHLVFAKKESWNAIMLRAK